MNILLIISGSISCYKSIELLRLYVKSGFQVKVILSKGSQNFLKPELFNYLGAANTYLYNDDFNPLYSKEVPLHIELARWTNIFVLCPMTANTLARLTTGIADDLITCTFLALDKEIKKCFYPAMNSKMLENDFVDQNLKKLEKILNTYIHPSDQGILACGEQGLGKLPEVEEIYYTSIYATSIDESRINFPEKNSLITTGATLAKLDPVRFITNPSSGLTGFELALESLRRGYTTTVIAGKYATNKLDYLKTLSNFKLIRVESTEQLFTSAKKFFKTCDFYFSPAAISDIQIKMENKKIKKDQLSNAIEINHAPDVLKELLLLKKKNQKMIGFAAETELTDINLAKKIKDKPVDLLVGTKVNHGDLLESPEGFQDSKAFYKIITREKTIHEGELKKANLAKLIFDYVDNNQGQQIK